MIIGKQGYKLEKKILLAEDRKHHKLTVNKQQNYEKDWQLKRIAIK